MLWHLWATKTTYIMNKMQPDYEQICQDYEQYDHHTRTKHGHAMNRISARGQMQIINLLLV